jgi:hypothetical protein
VYEWANKFKNGVNSVADAPRPGQAHRVITPETIAAAEGLIRADRRITVAGMADMLQMSVGSAYQIQRFHIFSGQKSDDRTLLFFRAHFQTRDHL